MSWDEEVGEQVADALRYFSNNFRNYKLFFTTIQIQPLDLRFPQFQIIVEEELIELRRFHRRAGQHGVHLATMMDVVDEEVGEQIADALRYFSNNFRNYNNYSSPPFKSNLSTSASLSFRS
ncbi:hypothetical protein MesoLjLa_42660 [Mesorhizobium sp. L-2-11]|nr:hypothetical protein MesoLjLa_42660 [Mesorhizobium sp. L-2-11]